MGPYKLSQLTEIFMKMFPAWKDKGVVNYGAAGGEAVRVTLKDGTILIFTYKDERTWMLETLKNYANRNA